jgi:hypothetical protein
MAAYRRASRGERFWWGIRPRAVDLARAAKVDADVEAAIRNRWQISRTWSWGFLLTLPLTWINIWVLGHKFDLTTTWSALALAVGQVGGFFSLTRSNETRSYLGEVRLLLHELSARSILASAVSYAREIGECERSDQLRRRATVILSHLRDSRLFPREVSAFSVWARDDARLVWRIVAALGASEQTIANFTQHVVAVETPGAGVVANLAATADDNPRYYQPSADRAPNRWFKPDPGGKAATQTLAVFLLPDEAGIPVGAFAITSPLPDALEAETDGPSERLSLIIEQCSLTLVGVARRAQQLWERGD